MFGIKKIDALLLKSFVGPFLVTLSIALLVFILQFLWKHIDDLIGKGFETDVLLELVFYLSLSLIPMVLPLAILLASIITFGNLGEHYELVALKSAGIGLLRFMRPLFIAVVGIALIAFYFSNWVLPVVNLKYHTKLYSVVRSKPALNLKEGVFNSEITNYVIKIGKKDPDNETLHDVKIWDHTAKGDKAMVISAERGQMYVPANDSVLIFRLYNGFKYDEMKETPEKRGHHEHMRMSFKEFDLIMDMSMFEFDGADESIFKRNPKMLGITQLLAELDSLQIRRTRLPQKLRKQVEPYFKVVKKDIEEKESADTLFAGINHQTADSSLLSLLSFPKTSRDKLLRKARDDARNVKSFTSYASKQSSGKSKKSIQYWIYIYNKFALSFSCLVLFLIGAATGAIIRKGGLGMPMVISIILFMAYHVLNTIGRKLAEELVISPFHGVWFASYVLTPLAIFLVYKAAMDSDLINEESWAKYAKFFRPITFVIRRARGLLGV